MKEESGFQITPPFPIPRLTSERGLPALRHMFDNVKFKGKGHEVRAGELCFVSWEVNVGLPECCPCDLGSTDRALASQLPSST